MLIGAVVIGGVIALASSRGGGGAPVGGGATPPAGGGTPPDGGGTPPGGGGSICGPQGCFNGGGTPGGGGRGGSDARIKTDMRWVETLENGIRLHAFRYKGDDQVFVGVLAQELLTDDRYAHAVHVIANGAFLVDYEALGLQVVGWSKMRDAGERALARFDVP